MARICKQLTVEEFNNPPPGGWGQGFSTKKACDCSNTCDPCFIINGTNQNWTSLPDDKRPPGCPDNYPGFAPGAIPTGTGDWNFLDGNWVITNFDNSNTQTAGYGSNGEPCTETLVMYSYEYKTKCPCDFEGGYVDRDLDPNSCGYNDYYQSNGCFGWFFSIPSPPGAGLGSCCYSALS